MILFDKVAAILHHGLDPGPVVLAGPHHSVPVDAVHHLLPLLDQEVCSVMKTWNSAMPHKK